MLQLERTQEESKSFFYSEFKRSFERLASEVERSEPKCAQVRDPSHKGRKDVNELAEKAIEFYKMFDSWHCGLNQLKTFKKLSYQLSVAPQNKIKQALDLVPTTTINS